MAINDAKAIAAQFDKLKSKRANWENHWQEVADYCLPRRADVTKSRSKGDKRTEFIFDGTPRIRLTLFFFTWHANKCSHSVV